MHYYVTETHVSSLQRELTKCPMEDFTSIITYIHMLHKFWTLNRYICIHIKKRMWEKLASGVGGQSLKDTCVGRRAWSWCNSRGRASGCRRFPAARSCNGRSKSHTPSCTSSVSTPIGTLQHTPLHNSFWGRRKFPGHQYCSSLDRGLRRDEAWGGRK